MECQSVSVSPLLQSASGTASVSPCRTTSSSLPSPSSSPSSSSPLQPPCWRYRAGQSGNAAAADGPDAGTKCPARLTPHDTRKARTSRPRRKRGRTDGEGTRTVALTRGLTRTHLPHAENFMTASGRRVQLDRRSARWRSCFANRRCTTPTRETVASQRIGPWQRTTPKSTSGNRPLLRYMHPAAASTSIPRRCTCKIGTVSCAHSCAVKETRAPTATRGLSRGPRTSTALLIFDGRHNSHGDATNLALARGTTPSLLSCWLPVCRWWQFLL